MSYIVVEATNLSQDLEQELKGYQHEREDVKREKRTLEMQITRLQASRIRRHLSMNHNKKLLELGQEINKVDKRLRLVEAKILPLEKAVADLAQVVTFANDNELPADQAESLILDIIGGMSGDLNLTRDTQSSAAAGHMPLTLMDELKTKMEHGALRPQNVYGLSSKSSSNLDDGSYDTKIGTSKVVNPKDNWKNSNFARVSKKLNKVKSLSRRAVGGVSRAEAFRFEAVDRADAFKEVDYEAPAYYGPEFSDDSETDRMSSISEVPSEDMNSPMQLKASINENILMSLGINPDEIAQIKSQGKSRSPSEGTGTGSESTGVSSDAPGGIPGNGLGSVHPGGNRDSENGLGINLEIRDSTSTEPGGLGGFGGSVSAQSAGVMKGSAAPQFAAGQSAGQGAAGNHVDDVESAALQSPLVPRQGAEQKTGNESICGKSATLAGFGQTSAGGKGVSGSAIVDRESGVEEPKSTTPKPVGAGDNVPVTLNVQGDESKESPRTMKLKMVVDQVKKAPPPPPKKAPPPPPPPSRGKGGGRAPPPPPAGRRGGRGGRGAPPPPAGGRGRGGGLKREPLVIEVFQELRRQLIGNQQTGGGGPKKSGGKAAAEPADAASLMSEMQKNSPYQMRINENIEEYGSIIKDLAREVANFKAENMKIMVKFVDSTDAVLDELEDEIAVLKQFDWPKKYQTFREARFMYEKLQAQKQKLKEWPRNAQKTAPIELADIQKYMESTIEEMDKLERTKDADEKKYKEAGIPWDKKIIGEVKVSSLELMDVYMKIALEEVGRLEKDEENEVKRMDKITKILNGTVKFAFKVHQFAGGFNDGCSIRFKDVSARLRSAQGN